MSWAGVRRNWKAIAIGVVIFLIGIGIGAASAGSKKGKTSTVAGPTVTQTITRTVTRTRIRYKTKVVRRVAPAPTPPPSSVPPPPPPPPQASDKDFSVQALQIQDDGLGDIGGIARVTNNASTSKSGSFTFTFFQGGQIVGTASGAAQSVAPGQTVTVQLVSQSSMISGSFRYQFQVDFEY